jgi:hypothetical protein
MFALLLGHYLLLCGRSSQYHIFSPITSLI